MEFGFATKIKGGRQAAALMLYTAWNVLKERNRRMFDGVSARPTRILQLIKR